MSNPGHNLAELYVPYIIDMIPNSYRDMRFDMWVTITRVRSFDEHASFIPQIFGFLDVIDCPLFCAQICLHVSHYSCQQRTDSWKDAPKLLTFHKFVFRTSLSFGLRWNISIEIDRHSPEKAFKQNTTNAKHV